MKETKCDYHIYTIDHGRPDTEKRCDKIATKYVDLSSGKAVGICKYHLNKINNS
jgi:hypothetical protein